MNGRPKIGIALSGASGRAIAHIAVLEVLRENQIPIDYIVGCSSGSLIAASYAIGTMETLKKFFYNLTLSKMVKLWSTKNAKGGIFHLHSDKMQETLNTITHDLNFEDIESPKIGFSATDIHTGELVTLKTGSINKAFKASVAIPGLLEPVVWDHYLLVDGGLVNIVPTLPVKQMGADIVIGINLAATKFIYEKKMPIWRGYRFFTRLTGLQFIREKVIQKLSPRLLFRIDSQSDVLEEEDIKIPGVISVLSKAIDHSFRIEEQWDESHVACDLMIEPKVKHFGKTEFNSLEKIYLEGRRAAQEAVPIIKKLINEYQAGK
ncbi:MAG: patatin-like phospholipase family protein [Candidatus Doudnabacteria bacterium]|nr:patatin-like phospholipase family protein [Candidatus Doudnabacteria bacterium]